jgi:hypothetical protein
VLSEPEGVPPLTEPMPPAPVPPDQAFLAKITPDLKAVLANEEAAGQPLRIEAIFWGVPLPDERGWKRDMTDLAPSVIIEGQLGQIVTILMRGSDVPALAALPTISTLRLPRSGAVQAVTAPEAPAGDRLQASGLSRLRWSARSCQPAPATST